MNLFIFPLLIIIGIQPKHHHLLLFFWFSRFFFSIELLIKKSWFVMFFIEGKRLKKFQKRNEKVIKIQHLLFLRIWKKIWTLYLISCGKMILISYRDFFFNFTSQGKKYLPSTDLRILFISFASLFWLVDLLAVFPKIAKAAYLKMVLKWGRWWTYFRIWIEVHLVFHCIFI